MLPCGIGLLSLCLMAGNIIKNISLVIAWWGVCRYRWLDIWRSQREGGKGKSTGVPLKSRPVAVGHLAGTPAFKRPARIRDKLNIHLSSLAWTFCDFAPRVMIAVWKTAVAIRGRHQETLKLFWDWSFCQRHWTLISFWPEQLVEESCLLLLRWKLIVHLDREFEEDVPSIKAHLTYDRMELTGS